MEWLEVTIKTSSEASEAIAEILMQLGAQGIATQDPEELRFIYEDPDTTIFTDADYLESLDEHVVIRSYFPEFVEGVAYRPVSIAESPLVDTESLYSKEGYPDQRGSREEFLQFLQLRLDQVQAYLDLGEGITGVKIVQDADWAEGWKQYYEPIQVSPRLTIVPSWIEYSAKGADEQLIRLDPGSAFGTGDHPTTALCLQLLDQFLPIDARVADVGTGSGVLAIGSALLGARQVDAVDIDPNAVKVARENVELNGQSERITVEVGVLDDLEGRYEIIVANLVADLLLELKESFASYLQPLGLLIVSGIVSERAEEIKAAYEQLGYQLFHEADANEWSALVFSHSGQR